MKQINKTSSCRGEQFCPLNSDDILQDIKFPCADGRLTWNSSFKQQKCLFLPADIGAERYTFGFTVRDSPSYFINVNSWGREEYVKSLSESFRVGDCGKPEVYSQHISVFQYVFSLF